MTLSIVLAILSFLTALLPLAERGIVTAEHIREHRHQARAPQMHTVEKPVLPPNPPEVGQPNVVFFHGEWWKYENGVWFVWRQNVNQLARGGYANVVR